MYRVRGNVDILTNKVDGDDYEVMDMLHIVTNAAFRETLRSAIANNNVTRCTTRDLIGDVAGKAELAVIPTNFDLGDRVSRCQIRSAQFEIDVNKLLAIKR